jgi:hypothetical protein
MYAKLLHNLISPIVAITVIAIGSVAFGQGTATGPFSSHVITGTFVEIDAGGGVPFPIDLDPGGLPWTKDIIDPFGTFLPGGVLTIRETIVNVGNEPWFDWHEHILPDAVGAIPGVWTSVNLLINGGPIAFLPTGLGTADLWLDNFSQPVLPGDILTVNKEVQVFASTGGVPGAPLLTIEEYPTPEPASAALLSLGSLLVLGRRKEAL